MRRVRISLISYTNTKPFVYGLQQDPDLPKQAEFSFDTPAECARKLIDDEADLGIVPIAALPSIPSYSIVSDFCIASDGPVNSVFLLTDRPLDQVKTIRKDAQSKTSNGLAQILCIHFWKIQVRFIEYDSAEKAEACVLIGDRTFGQKEGHHFQYDLAGEWKNFCQLPFVFAVWASNKELDPEFTSVFNRALSYGVAHRPDVLKELPRVKNFDLRDYLMQRLQYTLDEKKRESMQLYLSYLKTI